MSKLLFSSILIAIGCVILMPHVASAHVLIEDDSKHIGAVLHVVPDDDPIAGKPSGIFFELQGNDSKNRSAHLEITDDTKNTSTEIAVTLDANSINATYTFPTQGVYELKLVVVSEKTYTFHYAQRVSRGVLGDESNRRSFPLANAALISATISLCFLTVVLIDNRDSIKKHSTF